MKKGISIFTVGLFVFSFLFFALPSGAQEDVSGCCQFFIDDAPGCMYPSSPDGCAGGKLKGTFLEGEKCDIDTGYCSGYQKDEAAPSESGE